MKNLQDLNVSMSHLSSKDVNRVKSYVRQSWVKVDSLGMSDRYLLWAHTVWLMSQGWNTIVGKTVTFQTC